MKKSIFKTSALSLILMLSFTTSILAQNKSKGAKNNNNHEVVSKNEQLGKDFVETVMNAKSPDQLVNTINRLFTIDFSNHNPMVAPGTDGLIKFVGTVGESFLGSKAIVKEVIANKDKVMVAWTFEGTLTGKPFFGVPASGQKVKIDIVDWWKVENGKFVEHWDVIDWISLLSQLGVKEIPEPFKNIAFQKIK